jgi:hypothetical protein
LYTAAITSDAAVWLLCTRTICYLSFTQGGKVQMAFGNSVAADK